MRYLAVDCDVVNCSLARNTICYELLTSSVKPGQ